MIKKEFEEWWKCKVERMSKVVPIVQGRYLYFPFERYFFQVQVINYHWHAHRCRIYEDDYMHGNCEGGRYHLVPWDEIYRLRYKLYHKYID